MINEIMNRMKCIKEEYQNNVITSEEMIEHLDDLIHDVEGKEQYNGFGTALEDDGFYDELPDFSTLQV